MLGGELELGVYGMLPLMWHSGLLATVVFVGGDGSFR